MLKIQQCCYLDRGRLYFTSKDQRLELYDKGVSRYCFLIGIFLKCFGLSIKAKSLSGKIIYLNKKSLNKWISQQLGIPFRKWNQDFVQKCIKILDHYIQYNLSSEYIFFEDINQENPPPSKTTLIARARDRFRDNPEKEEILRSLERCLDSNEYEFYFEIKKIPIIYSASSNKSNEYIVDKFLTEFGIKLGFNGLK